MTNLTRYNRIEIEEFFVGSNLGASEPENPQIAVVVWPEKPPIFTYRYCYLERAEFGSNKQHEAESKHHLINPQSLCQLRCRIVARWIRDIVHGMQTRTRALQTAQIFDWIDQNDRNSDLFDTEGAKRLYEDFTDYLVQLIKARETQSGDGIGYGFANALQATMRIVLEYAVDQTQETIKDWATKIRSRPPRRDPLIDRFTTVSTVDVIVSNDLGNYSSFVPEQVQVIYPGSNRITRNYLYCYLDRATLIDGVSKNNGSIWKLVATSSLCQKRCSIITKWIEDQMSGSVSWIASRYMGSVFDWIDKSERNDDLFSRRTAKKLYIDFTDHLLKEAGCSSNDRKSRKPSYYADLQSGLRQIITYTVNEPDSEIAKWAHKLNQRISYDDLPNFSRFSEVHTIELIADSVDLVSSNIQPERTIVRFPIARNLKINAYRYCYLDRAFLATEVSVHTDYANQVNTTSLCVDRCKLVTKWIKYMVTGAWAYNRAQSVGHALNWIDENERSDDLHDNESVKKLYIDFTNHLLHRSRLARTGPQKGIGTSAAKRLQNGLVDVIHLATNKPEALIRTWALSITRVNPDLPQPRLNDREAQLAYEMHRRFFWAYSQAILTGESIPIIVRLTDLGFDDFIAFGYDCDSYNGYSPRKDGAPWRKFAFSETGFDFDWHSVKNKARAHGVNLTGLASSHWRVSSQLLSFENQFTTSSLKAFANRAIKHFGYMLLFASGCNADHLGGLDLTQSFLPKAGGSNRIVAFKSRSLNEPQTLSVNQIFQKQWRQLLRLREWMADFYSLSPPDYGLCVVTFKAKPPNSYSSLNSTEIQRALAWPKSGPNFTTRTPRKVKIQKGLELSGGDINLVAGMVSNKPETIRGHYSFKKFEDSAKQLSSFFLSMQKSANLRVSGAATAPIIDEGENILIGKCIATSEEDRDFIEGIDKARAPKLNCGSPLACLFCKSFGILDSYQDIHRLLSVAAYIQYQSRHKSQTINEHVKKFLPAVARIEEIVDAFAGRSEASKVMTEKAKIAINKGELDEYWLAETTALLDAMEAA